MVKKKSTAIKSVTITIPLNIAETLASYVDGALSGSYDEEFTNQFAIIAKKLERGIFKHYKPQIKTD